MTAQTELLLPPVTQRLLQAAARNPSGAYLFEGPSGTGRTSAARELMRSLNCRGDENGPCASCQALAGGNHPDFITVAPLDKPSISTAQVRALLPILALEPYSPQGWRMVLVDPGEALSGGAQSALLKMLEEPPVRTVFVLTSTAAEHLLPTIRSRTQLLRFDHLPVAEICAYLQQHGFSSAEADHAARVSNGLIARALGLRKAGNTSEDSAAREAALVLLTGPRFAALLEAKRVGEAKESVIGVVTSLEAAARATMRSTDANAAPEILPAVAHLRERLDAGVMPRAALEAFVLESRP